MSEKDERWGKKEEKERNRSKCCKYEKRDKRNWHFCNEEVKCVSRGKIS